LLKRIDHVAIVVDDLQAAGRFLIEAVGCTEAGRVVDIPGRLRAVFFTLGDSQLEVIEVTDPSERMRRLGGADARIEHIAVEVDDVKATRRSLSEHGVQTTRPDIVAAAGSLSIWTVPESSDGLGFQFLQKTSGE
jgi:methylmalonyl-CoA/ethylmalonyl-CoA epimerase